VSGVHWLLCHARDVPAGESWLTPGERRVLGGLRMAKRRRDWRLGRWTAKRALAAWLARSGEAAVAEAIEIAAAADGAPEAFRGDRPLPCALSLSHRGGWGLCAVGPPRTALGCDLELVEMRSPEFAADYLTEEERRLAAGLPGEVGPSLLWSAKESALKAARVGLRADARSVQVRRLEGDGAGGWQPLEVDGPEPGTRRKGWWRREGECLVSLVASAAPASRLDRAPRQDLLDSIPRVLLASG
jgi:4'-phosphopantetheinyl transferase